MFGMFNKKSTALEFRLNDAQQQKQTAKQALAELQAKFDAQASDLAAAHAETAQAKQDGDAATKVAKEDAQAKTKALAELQAQLSEKTQSASKLQALVSKAENDLAAAVNQIKETQAKNDAANKELIELRAKMDATGKELAAAKSTATAAQQGLESALNESKSLQSQVDALSKESIDLKKTIDAQKTEIAKIRADLEKSVSQKVQDKTKQDDMEQENELLLTQLMEVQEELEVFYLDKVKFENLYQEMQVRWTRLEKRYPNYVDFGSIELVAFDNLSDTPSITWRAKDYVQGSVVFDEFVFHTILHDGQPGISIESDAKGSSLPNSALVPKLIKPQSKEFEQFVRMGQSDFGKIIAAAAIIAQLEVSGWRGVKLPQNFDLGFWRQSLKLLPAQLQALPLLLRYDAVKLKRELINPDYEHLWLEIKGMGLGSRTWPKFEIRLGAAMVERNGFSKYPKFEIPLIDGKKKPFESWYAESQDDNGAKLELRFSLEKQVFDTSVWSRLDGPDKALFMRLIYAMPSILLRLEAEHVAIHRPWASWVDMAKSAMQVIEVNRIAAQSKDLPAPESKSAAIESAAVAPVQLLASNTKKTTLEKTTTKKTPTTKQGSKSAAKLATAVKKNVDKTRSKLVKKASKAKQVLPIKKAATPKKAQSSDASTKSVAKKIGRKK
jgi:hypothetical protein